MGLDMYLSAEKFVSGYNHAKDENFGKILDLLKLDEKDVDDFMTVNVTVGYWRKANAVHNWFVQNVQSGEDNCARYYVSPEKLKELRKDCKDALDLYLKGDKNGSSDILEPTSGFFFGSTEIDDWYAKDLSNTIEIIDKCLSGKFDGYDFFYRSSW